MLANLGLRRKLAQLLAVGVTGPQDAIDAVDREGVGTIFIGSWTDRTVFTSITDIAAHAKNLPLGVSIDEEGGRVSRASSVIGVAPSARELAATSTVDVAYQQAKQRGAALKKLGITIDYAPVVDVFGGDPDGVIGDRSFSGDPAVVAQYAAAYARGLRDGGVFPVLKHFPGHGHASGDSHVAPVTTPPLTQLQDSDLLPYRQLVSTPVGVMVGHLDVPGLTSAGVPASLSPAAMALLRQGTGYAAPAFTGPIFTDDLSGMGAITSRYPIGEAALAALKAGADVALWISTDSLSAVLDRLVTAVNSGELPVAQVNDAIGRVAASKMTVSSCLAPA